MYYAEVHHHPIVEPAYPINLKVLGVIGTALKLKKCMLMTS
jgi:hypothetical protein